MLFKAKSIPFHHLTIRFLAAFWILTIILTACATPSGIPPTTISTVSPTSAIPNTAAPTGTPSPTATAVRTPPALPEIFISGHLNSNDIPHTYIEDTCEYLKNRWDPDNAAPGTIVMVIMLRSINRGQARSSDSITVIQFNRMVENLREQGFEAINTEQLAGFLERNEYIPPRSVLFLQDGRYTADNFNRHFLELWQAWGWSVANAWITQDNTADVVSQENLSLEQEGWVDHQLYSPLQRYRQDASEEFLSAELKKYTNGFEELYNKSPIVITWPVEPGENFIQAARDRGLRLGFTSNTRGPIMYNWIPLANRADPKRPAYYPEGPFDDPLMTLPRYWAAEVVESLDTVRRLGKDAAAYAEAHREAELEYYDIVCAPEL